ncbi:MAG: hypothetical protein ACKO4K_03815 [Flavobacteriales bacterium]|jgi:uncharacterized membrane protein YidH (DUF202 family)
MFAYALILAALSLGVLFKIDGRKKNFIASNTYGNVFLIGGIFLAINYGAFRFLKNGEWMDDQFQTFCYLLVATSVLLSLILSVLFVLSARNSAGKLGKFVGYLWVILSLGGGYFGYQKASKVNDGWTKEKIERVKNNIPSEYNAECAFKYIQTKYKDPAAYDASLEKDRENREKSWKNTCLKCDPVQEKKQTLVVDGLPD